MNPDFDIISGGGPAAEASTAALSAEARARKRDLLPVLQGQLARRCARRQAITGGAVATAAAVLVAAGAMATLTHQSRNALLVDQQQTALPGPGPEETPGQRHERPALPRVHSANFTLVRNDPSVVERHRIDDRRLVQELRSAGYEAGLVRTPEGVFIMMNDGRE